MFEQILDSHSSTFNFTNLNNQIIHKTYNIGTNFNKSKLINKFIEYIDTDYVWIMDADFYANYPSIEQFVSKSSTDLLRPFRRIVQLNEEETKQCINGGCIRLSGNYEINTATGKFSIVVKRDIIRRCGGFDENYTEWGFQDLDFINNRVGNCTRGCINIDAVHLFHPPSKSNKSYVKNKNLYYANKSIDNAMKKI